MSDRLFGLERNHRIADGEDVALLTTVRDIAMLGIVRGLLEDAGIPYLVHERATGSAMRIMTGFSLFGTDIFVPSAALETARTLIAGFEETCVDSEGKPEEDEAETDNAGRGEGDTV